MRDTDERPAGLARRRGSPGSSRISTPMRRMTASRPVRAGVEVDALEPHLRVAEQRARHQVGGGRGEVARHLHVGQRRAPRPGRRRPTAPPSRSSGTPAASSIRSVWSRDGTGSCTQVVPSAKRPASSRQLFTCALATSRWCSMPRSGAPPLTTSGGVPPGAVKTWAPIARSGRAMRVIGRPRSDSSPSSTTWSMGCPTRIPAKRRISVPALAQSSAGGGRRPRRPRPVMRTASPRWPVTATPQASTACEGGAGVGRVERPADPDLAVGDAASMSARWVSDLSGGTWTVPRSRVTGATRTTAIRPSLTTPRRSHRRGPSAGRLRRDRAGDAQGGLLAAGRRRAPGARRRARASPRPGSPGRAPRSTPGAPPTSTTRASRPPASGLASGAGHWRSSTREPSAPVQAMITAGGADG